MWSELSQRPKHINPPKKFGGFFYSSISVPSVFPWQIFENQCQQFFGSSSPAIHCNLSGLLPASFIVIADRNDGAIFCSNQHQKVFSFLSGLVNSYLYKKPNSVSCSNQKLHDNFYIRGIKNLYFMPDNYIADQTFKKADFTLRALPKTEYENCKFINCDFSNTDLSGVKFLDCEFISCNLSLASLTKTSFIDVNFQDCKMLGLRFENCNDFGLAFSFSNCKLDHSSFYKLKLKKTDFKNSQLHEVDFSESDLANSTFDNCDLLNATFDRTILEKADFRTAYHYSIDPDNNRIKKARFSKSGLAGLLHKHDIQVSE